MAKKEAAATAALAAGLRSSLITDAGLTEFGGIACSAGLTDKAWGYNFAWTVPAAYIQNGGDRYRVDLKFAPVTTASDQIGRAHV